MALPQRSYSFSRLEMFDSCPFAFKKVYLEKVPRAESEALKIGSLSHQLVADYLNRLILSNLQTDWEWAERIVLWDAPPDVPEIWERFYQTFMLPPMVSPGVEEKIAFNRAWQPVEFFGKDAFFRLVVDFTFLQESLAVVVDWKTNRVIPQTVEKKLQLRIYGWGVRQALYPTSEEVLLRLHFLRYGAEREILLARGDLDTVPQELGEKIATIEVEKDFNPTPGSFCGWCGVVAHCPVMAQALIPANILYPTARGDAQEAARLLLTIQTVATEIRGHLKGWVQQNGPINVGDMVYGPSPTESLELDPRTVTERLLDMGVDRDTVWSLVRVTKGDIEKFARKLLPRKKEEQRQLLESLKEGSSSKTGEMIGFTKAA